MPDNNAPITMKDIARKFGVSVATVSRALKGNTRISEETRNKITAYAREHNFSPNLMAESLRSNKTMKIIGVILPQFTHFYFSSVLSGIEDEALRHGYRLLVAQSGEEYEREVDTCRSFYENKVCGIIVSQAKDTRNYDHFQRLIDIGLPLVFFDRICTGVNSSRVTVDDYMGAFSAVEYLIGTGCRNIAFYGTTMKLEISKNRYNGWYDALRKHGLNPDECVKMECDTGAVAGILLYYNDRFYVGTGYGDGHLYHWRRGKRRGGNSIGKRQIVWLKLRRENNIVTGYYSLDGSTWLKEQWGLEISGYNHNTLDDFQSVLPGLFAYGTGEVRFTEFKYRELKK